MKSGVRNTPNKENNMRTKHTYSVTFHGSKTATETGVLLDWPETLLEFCQRVEGGEERVYGLLRGFVAAHHVQSKVKSAAGSEKRSDEQRKLLELVEAGEALQGASFVPKERGEAKLDKVAQAILANWDGWTDAQREAFAGKYGAADSAESAVKAYQQWKADPLAGLV
jgi:hypothetical protein